MWLCQQSSSHPAQIWIKPLTTHRRPFQLYLTIPFIVHQSPHANQICSAPPPQVKGSNPPTPRPPSTSLKSPAFSSLALQHCGQRSPSCVWLRGRCFWCSSCWAEQSIKGWWPHSISHLSAGGGSAQGDLSVSQVFPLPNGTTGLMEDVYCMSVTTFPRSATGCSLLYIIFTCF